MPCFRSGGQGVGGKGAHVSVLAGPTLSPATETHLLIQGQVPTLPSAPGQAPQRGGPPQTTTPQSMAPLCGTWCSSEETGLTPDVGPSQALARPPGLQLVPASWTSDSDITFLMHQAYAAHVPYPGDTSTL